MVDPNRKINRHTQDHVQFLDQIDEEFSNRFTDDDDKFMEHCAKAVSEPPLVQNWNTANKQRFGNSSQSSGYRGNYGGGGGGGPYKNQRTWTRRSGGGGGDGGRYRPHRRHNDGRGGGGYHSNQQRTTQKREENFAPINIPRNYANFVAASKD